MVFVSIIWGIFNQFLKECAIILINILATCKIQPSFAVIEYYIGVDPKKLKEKGDLVLVCGGDSNGQFRDIFLIPWVIFFQTLSAGDPKNTYRPPKEYIQYRCYLRDRNTNWVMSVQPAGRRELDMTQWHYSVDEAIRALKSKE